MRIVSIILLMAVAVGVTKSQQQVPARLVARDTGDRLPATKPEADKGKVSESDKLANPQFQQDPQASRATTAQVPPQKGIMPLSSFEFWLSVIILAFTLVVMLTEVWLIRSGTLTVTADSAIRVVLVTLIIGGTMFLIASGYSNDQIAPAMGLFGTIAGYLLGKSSGPSENGSSKKDKG